MRHLAAVIALGALGGCSSPARPAAQAPAPASTAAAAAPPPGPARPRVETLTGDTPRTTPAGNSFIAPGGWTLRAQGPGVILETPERGSVIAIYDLPAAKDATDAIAQAWKLYKGKQPYQRLTLLTAADRDGWTHVTNESYVVSPNERRDVGTGARFANGVWTVLVFDMASDVSEKRGAQVNLVYGKLLPKGIERESFAGKAAQPLDAARIAALQKFVDDGRAATGVPGVAFGLIQGGKIVFHGGSGTRQLGKRLPVDGKTKFMIASNTKALATLMLAKLVDAKRITWETPAVELLPAFRLGDAETTRQVQVKHLICACTGLPRQDMEWLFQWDGVTPEQAMAVLGTMQPTSKFGELFQYSNPLAAAAGFIGGHVAYPKQALGPAFDQAMQSYVFKPLGMTATTFDFKRGQAGNAALPHAPDIDGKPALAIAKVNTSIVPVRPAGGAWSTVDDMLKYVQMELAEGTVGGKPYTGKDALLARRAPQVAISTDATYGMGLMVDRTWGVTVVHHGGDMIGFHSDMMWLPEVGVGAVILTNGDPGWMIRSQFQRKLLEVLFDGTPEADAKLAASAKAYHQSLAAERALLTLPADPTAVAALAPRYTNAALGEIAVRRTGARVTFDFGEYASDVATKANPDGTVSFVTTVPGMTGLELVAGSAAGGPTLTIRDPQHEYVFTAAK